MYFVGLFAISMFLMFQVLEANYDDVAHRHAQVGVLVDRGVDHRAVVVRLVPEQKVLVG